MNTNDPEWNLSKRSRDSEDVPVADESVLLEVEGLVKHFPSPRAQRRAGISVIHALCGASFTLDRGQSLGIVGESGSGKTTLMRTILGLHKATAGSIRFQGREVAGLSGKQARLARKGISVVFQDPYLSLDPRMTVFDLIAEPGRIAGVAPSQSEVRALLDQVQLTSIAMTRFAHEFSGGQRQRIAIARALALNPKLLVLDEPVSALDVSVQAELLTLLKSLRDEHDIACLLVAHDLAVVAEFCDRVCVMSGGHILESGKTSEVVSDPQHPYTRDLLSVVPIPDPVLERSKPVFVEPSWPNENEPRPVCEYGDRL